MLAPNIGNESLDGLRHLPMHLTFSCTHSLNMLSGGTSLCESCERRCLIYRHARISSLNWDLPRAETFASLPAENNDQNESQIWTVFEIDLATRGLIVEPHSSLNTSPIIPRTSTTVAITQPSLLPHASSPPTSSRARAYTHPSNPPQPCHRSPSSLAQPDCPEDDCQTLPGQSALASNSNISNLALQPVAGRGSICARFEMILHNSRRARWCVDGHKRGWSLV